MLRADIAHLIVIDKIIFVLFHKLVLSESHDHETRLFDLLET